MRRRRQRPDGRSRADRCGVGRGCHPGPGAPPVPGPDPESNQARRLGRRVPPGVAADPPPGAAPGKKPQCGRWRYHPGDDRWAAPPSRFLVPEGPLHPPQALIGLGHLCGRQVGVGSEDELAIQTDIPLNRGLINGDAAFAYFEKADVAAVADDGLGTQDLAVRAASPEVRTVSTTRSLSLYLARLCSRPSSSPEASSVSLRPRLATTCCRTLPPSR